MRDAGYPIEWGVGTGRRQCVAYFAGPGNPLEYRRGAADDDSYVPRGPDLKFRLDAATSGV